jgi:hypothetical protein
VSIAPSLFASRARAICGRSRPVVAEILRAARLAADRSKPTAAALQGHGMLSGRLEIKALRKS